MINDMLFAASNEMQSSAVHSDFRGPGGQSTALEALTGDVVTLLADAQLGFPVDLCMSRRGNTSFSLLLVHCGPIDGHHSTH